MKDLNFYLPQRYATNFSTGIRNVTSYSKFVTRNNYSIRSNIFTILYINDLQCNHISIWLIRVAY